VTLRFVKQDHFWFHASLLAVVTAISQGLGIVLILVATRLLSQVEFGHYMIFLSQGLLFGNFGVLAYHLLVPNLEEEDVSAFLTAMLFLQAVLAVLYVMIFAWGGCLWPVQSAILAAAVSWVRMMEMVNLRWQRMRLIAVIRILPNLIILLILTGAAVFSLPLASKTLAVAHGVTVSSISLFYTLCSCSRMNSIDKGLLRVGLRHLRGTRSFVMHVTPAELLNSAVYNLPVILMERLFSNGMEMAAQYGLVLRLCFGPVGVVGQAVAQTFHATLAAARRGVQRFDAGQFRRITKVLWSGGLAAGVFIFLLLPPFILWMNGPDWGAAGMFARLLAPLFCVMIAVAPLLNALYVMERFRLLLVSQCVYLLAVVISFGVGALLDSAVLAVFLFGLLSVIRYLVFGFEVRRVLIDFMSASAEDLGL